MILDDDLQKGAGGTPVELVDQNKFILFYFLSLGLYGIWWMYKSWKFFQEKDKLDIWPAARAIFAIFFAYSLFDEIQRYAQANGYQKSFSSGGMFAAFLLLNFSSRLPDPIGWLSLLAFLPLLPPLNALNYAISHSEEYEGVFSSRLNNRQVVLVVLGVLFWALIIIGLFFAEEGF